MNEDHSMLGLHIILGLQLECRPLQHCTHAHIEHGEHKFARIEHIFLPECCHGDNSVPKSSRNAVELCIRNILLSIEHNSCENYYCHA